MLVRSTRQSSLLGYSLSFFDAIVVQDGKLFKFVCLRIAEAQSASTAVVSPSSFKNNTSHQSHQQDLVWPKQSTVVSRFCPD
jgi:hypothetical protein